MNETEGCVIDRLKRHIDPWTGRDAGAFKCWALWTVGLVATYLQCNAMEWKETMISHDHVVYLESIELRFIVDRCSWLK